MKCRHCSVSLRNINGTIGCPQCKSHYISFASFSKLLNPGKFHVFERESAKAAMTSQYICDFCEKRMTTHFIENIQIESCYSCKQIWFDQGEFEKIKFSFSKTKKLNLNTDENSTFNLTRQVSSLDPFYFTTSDHHNPHIRKAKWVGIAIVYDIAIHLIYQPIRKMWREHPLISMIILITLYIVVKYYLRRSGIYNINWDIDLLKLVN